MKVLYGVAALLVLPLLVVVSVAFITTEDEAAAAADCGTSYPGAVAEALGVGTSDSTVVDALGGGSTDLPDVDGWSPEQVANAAAIIAAARTKNVHPGYPNGLPIRGQAIGVMTAIGESGLRVLDHGDAAGPDSRGLFQQRQGVGKVRLMGG